MMLKAEWSLSSTMPRELLQLNVLREVHPSAEASKEGLTIRGVTSKVKSPFFGFPVSKSVANALRNTEVLALMSASPPIVGNSSIAWA